MKSTCHLRHQQFERNQSYILPASLVPTNACLHRSAHRGEDSLDRASRWVLGCLSMRGIARA